ncbi:MAG: hypothetical protein WC326_13105 [Candidatus Delongbacteria bacterium]
MYHVLGKETTVTIGERVFSPVQATTFAEELPAEVAERADLLLIEEVPDEQPAMVLGGLSATGTLQTGAGEAGGAGTDATVATEGEGTAPDPSLLTDEALTNGVALITVSDDDEDTGGQGMAPDPFADPTEGPAASAGQTHGPAPKDAPAGKGGRGGKK